MTPRNLKDTTEGMYASGLETKNIAHLQKNLPSPVGHFAIRVMHVLCFEIGCLFEWKGGV